MDPINQMKTGRGAEYFEILLSGPNDPKPKNRASKVPYTCALWYPKSKIFVRFPLQLAVFEIFHILGFPLTPMLKFQSAINFIKLGRLPRRVIACIPLLNCWRSSVLKFPAPYAPVLTKIFKCHHLGNFWQIAKTVIAHISP